MSSSAPPPPADPDTKPRRRGIYLLPNLFTTGALFSGFYAIVGAIQGRYEAAALAIFISMILDGMDGRIARLTNTQSDFGTEYDSLADLVSFGLAPALLMFQWSLIGLGKPGWLAAFIFTACAALRLARFNTQVAKIDKAYFQGLPSPAAAALIAGMIWNAQDIGLEPAGSSIFNLVLTVLVGLLMVSNVRYYSFKNLDLKSTVPFIAILGVVLVFVLLSVHPPLVLFGLAFIYALSGPILTLWGRHKKRASSKVDKSGEE